MVVLSSSYDNYTIKNHKFGTQKSVFLFFLAGSSPLRMMQTKCLWKEKCEKN